MNFNFSKISIIFLIIIAFCYPSKANEEMNTGTNSAIDYSKLEEELLQKSEDVSVDQIKISSVFSKNGRQLEEKGEISNAIMEYSRSLLLNPDNLQAKQRLFVISLSDRLTLRERLGLMAFKDLNSYVDALEDKIAYFFNKKNALGQNLIAKGVNASKIENQFTQIKKKILNSQEYLQSLVELKEFDSSDPFALVNNSLTQKKVMLDARYKYIKEQFQYLRTLNSDDDDQYLPSFITLKNLKKASPEVSLSDENQKEFQVVAKVLPEISGPVPTNDLDVLKKELAYVRKELAVMKKQFDANQQRKESLTGQLADIAQNLSEKENILEDRGQYMLSLKKEVEDLKSRFELGQRIMMDKDDKITALTEDFKKLKIQSKNKEQELNTILSSKDEKLIEINGFLQIYKDKLNKASDVLTMNEANITTLEEQLVFVQKKVLEKDKQLMKTHSDLLSLEDQLNDVQRQISDLQLNPPVNQPQLEENILDLQSQLKSIHRYLLGEMRELGILNAELTISDLYSEQIQK